MKQTNLLKSVNHGWLFQGLGKFNENTLEFYDIKRMLTFVQQVPVGHYQLRKKITAAYLKIIYTGVYVCVMLCHTKIVVYLRK